MRRRSFIAFGLSAVAVPRTAVSGPRWRNLFNGRDLDAWEPLGDANWAVKAGVVSADRGVGFLVSKETFGDIDIRAEVWVSEDANSGIFIRCSNPVKIDPVNAYEVNLFDTRPDPAYGTGAIVNLAKVSPMPKAGGHWNVMEIKARGDRFDVLLNGIRTVDNVRDGRLSHGRIALQHGQGLVRFRKVQVRLL